MSYQDDKMQTEEIQPTDPRNNLGDHLRPKSEVGTLGRGRPKGRVSNTTLQARAFAKAFIESKEYRDSVARRIKSDTLPSGVEQMLWHYVYGKPKENISISFEDFGDLAEQTDEELEARAQQIIKDLRAARLAKQLADREESKAKKLLDPVIDATIVEVPEAPK